MSFMTVQILQNALTYRGVPSQFWHSSRRLYFYDDDAEAVSKYKRPMRPPELNVIKVNAMWRFWCMIGVPGLNLIGCSQCVLWGSHRVQHTALTCLLFIQLCWQSNVKHKVCLGMSNINTSCCWEWMSPTGCHGTCQSCQHKLQAQRHLFKTLHIKSLLKA